MPPMPKDDSLLSNNANLSAGSVVDVGFPGLYALCWMEEYDLEVSATITQHGDGRQFFLKLRFFDIRLLYHSA